MIDAKVIAETLKHGSKILICGNGGLAAESEHFAAEMMGKFAFESYLPCIALTTNSALITALANDMGFENVFSHQVAVLGLPGDILIAMTTSASKNILRACEMARGKGMTVFLLDHSALEGESIAEMQNNAIKLLHELAYEIKKELNADSQSK